MVNNHLAMINVFLTIMQFSMMTLPFFVGIGMDACIIPLRHGGLSLVQTTDFFYALVDDPYMQVRSKFMIVFSYYNIVFLTLPEILLKMCYINNQLIIPIVYFS